MRYDVQIKEQAAEDLKHLLRNEPKAYKKALQLIAELYEHPTSGTGCIAPLSLFQIAFSYMIILNWVINNFEVFSIFLIFAAIIKTSSR